MPGMILRAAAMAAALLPPLCASAAPLSFDQALDLATQRSEAARSAQAGVASASQAARAAGELPDPVLRVGVDNLPVAGSDRFTSRDSMTMKKVGIGQEWVSGDKRTARQAAAQSLVEREEAAVQATRADVRLQTALAYLDAWYAGESLKLTVQMEHHAHEEIDAARARMVSAVGSSQEVLALTAARGIAEDESAALRQQQAAARAALARWVGASAEELVTPPTLAPPEEAVYTARHPVVVVARRDAEMARREAGVARTNRRPNWTWDVSYGQRTGYPDMVSFGVSIPLTVAPAERQDRDIASKQALVDRAEANEAETVRMAAGEHRSLTGDATSLMERVTRYRAAVVAVAQQRVAAALAGYRSNQVPLVTLFEARHAEVEATRKLLDLQRDLARVQAQLALKPIPEGARP